METIQGGWAAYGPAGDDDFPDLAAVLSDFPQEIGADGGGAGPAWEMGLDPFPDISLSAPGPMRSLPATAAHPIMSFNMVNYSPSAEPATLEYEYSPLSGRAGLFETSHDIFTPTDNSDARRESWNTLTGSDVVAGSEGWDSSTPGLTTRLSPVSTASEESMVIIQARQVPLSWDEGSDQPATPSMPTPQ